MKNENGCASIAALATIILVIGGLLGRYGEQLRICNQNGYTSVTSIDTTPYCIAPDRDPCPLYNFQKCQ